MKFTTHQPRAAGIILRVIGITWGFLSLLFLFLGLGLRLLRPGQRFGAESITLPGVVASKWGPHGSRSGRWADGNGRRPGPPEERPLSATTLMA